MIDANAFNEKYAIVKQLTNNKFIIRDKDEK